MIIFGSPFQNTYVVISTEYGDEGRRELESFYRKINIKKEAYRDLGSPCSEKLLVPITKEASIINSGAKKVSAIELAASITKKTEMWRVKMATLASQSSGKAPTTYTNAFDYEDEPIRHNRRDNDFKNSNKEKIRQNRRNNTKRDISDKVEDDES